MKDNESDGDNGEGLGGGTIVEVKCRGIPKRPNEQKRERGDKAIAHAVSSG